MKRLVQQQIASQHLLEITLPSGELLVMLNGSLDTPIADTEPLLKILSPFDNCVIQRERLRSLFGFDYQIECYVPAAKRQFGYFCLPLLYGEQFIGRMDCKAHRSIKLLEIKSLHLAEMDKVIGSLDANAVIAAFMEALSSFMAFQQCEALTLTQVFPNHWQALLQGAIKSAFG
ncbi:crosslink repair DNA glycosylase YcaQ family protein [Shewanella sp. SNU WT4]|uniref:DNA glycosylase AlkZ-like family protein n=1 Tax=Shewanella sp. SNU WT4 TaxID=2590015 RepID=UPI0023F0D6C0|nr:crosslink repair DNA glycosylase YcaQ family protein [Shewanella sp. SNU WT4]